MPKIVDYPKSSLKNILAAANAINDLGGSCSIELCAEKLGKKVSGAFTNLITATVKYGFITHKRGQLETTPLYKDYMHAYTEDESQQILRNAFLDIPLFKKLYERFKNKKIPVDYFDKLLIKEFDVHENYASRVSKYFIDGARDVGLLDQNNSFIESIEETSSDSVTFEEQGSEDINTNIIESEQKYSVKIIGPDINSTIVISEIEDFTILEAMLNKVKKKINTIK